MVKKCIVCRRLPGDVATVSLHTNERKWCAALSIKTDTLPKYFYLCSQHFNEDSFIIYPTGRRVLKKTAYPSVLRSPVPSTSGMDALAHAERRFQWLRSFIRRHTKPMPEEYAQSWKNKLSLGYMLLSWNAFGFILYMFYTGKADWAKAYGLKTEQELKLSPGQQWTRSLGIKNATIYRIDGLKISKYEVHNDLEEENNADIKTSGSEEIKDNVDNKIVTDN